MEDLLPYVSLLTGVSFSLLTYAFHKPRFRVWKIHILAVTVILAFSVLSLFIGLPLTETQQLDFLDIIWVSLSLVVISFPIWCTLFLGYRGWSFYIIGSWFLSYGLIGSSSLEQLPFLVSFILAFGLYFLWGAFLHYRENIKAMLILGFGLLISDFAVIVTQTSSLSILLTYLVPCSILLIFSAYFLGKPWIMARYRRTGYMLPIVSFYLIFFILIYFPRLDFLSFSPYYFTITGLVGFLIAFIYLLMLPLGIIVREEIMGIGVPTYLMSSYFLFKAGGGIHDYPSIARQRTKAEKKRSLFKSLPVISDQFEKESITLQDLAERRNSLDIFSPLKKLKDAERDTISTGVFLMEGSHVEQLQRYALEFLIGGLTSGETVYYVTTEMAATDLREKLKEVLQEIAHRNVKQEKSDALWNRIVDRTIALYIMPYTRINARGKWLEYLFRSYHEEDDVVRTLDNLRGISDSSDFVRQIRNKLLNREKGPELLPRIWERSFKFLIVDYWTPNYAIEAKCKEEPTWKSLRLRENLQAIDISAMHVAVSGVKHRELSGYWGEYAWNVEQAMKTEKIGRLPIRYIYDNLWRMAPTSEKKNLEKWILHAIPIEKRDSLTLYLVDPKTCDTGFCQLLIHLSDFVINVAGHRTIIKKKPIRLHRKNDDLQ